MSGEVNNRAARVPAQLLIDPEALAGIAGGAGAITSAQVEDLLAMLAEVRDRLTAELAIQVTARQAAEMLGMSESWVGQNTAPKGMCIPCVRCGASVRYRPESLREWSREQEQRAVGGLN